MSRHVADYYVTPRWCVDRWVEALLPRHRPFCCGYCVEPCVGDGAIVDALGSEFAQPWLTNDLRTVSPPPRAEHRTGDAVDFLADLRVRYFDPRLFGVTNPPYSDADRIVQAGVETCTTFAALLRVTWLGGASRSAWLRKHPPTLYILPERPHFRPDGGGDNSPYAWCVWDSTLAPPTVVICASTSRTRRRHDERVARLRMLDQCPAELLENPPEQGTLFE